MSPATLKRRTCPKCGDLLLAICRDWKRGRLALVTYYHGRRPGRRRRPPCKVRS